VWGFDADDASVNDARAYADRERVAARFEVADAATVRTRGPFDVVLLLEVLHDLARPVEVQAAARAALADDGAVLAADEAVADVFTAPGDEPERLMYGWSIVHNLPASMVEQRSAAIGTATRPGRVKELAAGAGFGTVDVLPLDGGFFRLYQLRT
jgi:2-polyprenyl-3-methyl-5-hydroxy-6-metoxy-1,4-benzoquinol methylase